MRAALILSAALVAPSATARQSTGTLIPGRDSSAYVGSVGALRPKPDAVLPTLEQQPSGVALANGRGMAACLWKRQPNGAAALLKILNTSAFAAEVKRIMPTLQTCWGAQIRDTTYSGLGISNNALRGLVAEAYYRRKGWPNLPPANYSSVMEGSDWISSDPGQKVVLRTADCLAAREPGRVVALLSTEPDSLAEKSAFVTLAPAIPSCLEQGVSLSAKRAGMRLALASAIDRRARLSAAAVRKSS